MTRTTKSGPQEIVVPEVVSFRPDEASKQILKRAKAKGVSYGYTIKTALKGAR